MSARAVTLKEIPHAALKEKSASKAILTVKLELGPNFKQSTEGFD